MKLSAGTPLRIHLEWAPHDRRLVGRLATRDHRVYFEFAAEFLAAPLQLSPLKLALTSGIQEGPRRPFDGLHGVFADSMPDAWGRLLVDRRARRQGLSPITLGPLDRLACVGATGLGALVYEPEFEAGEAGHIDLDALAAGAAAVLDGTADDVLPELERLGGSPGGARPKVLLAWRPEDGHLVSGVDRPPGDHRAILVKFRAPQDPPDMGALEHAYASMARAAGVEVPPTRLLPATKGPGHFAIDRFDREGERRLHMHSLAGLLEADPTLPALDYEHLLRVTLHVTGDQRAVRQAFRRAAFNALAHNRDDHGKQFSFLMNQEGAWTLAPAYDLVFSEGPRGEHCTTVAGEGNNPGEADLRRLARPMSIPSRKVDAILEEVRAALADWSRHAADAGVTRVTRDRVTAALRASPG